MEWSVLVLVLALSCSQVSSGRAEWKRLTRLEEIVHQLTREVKDLKAVRCRQERTGETGPSSEEIKLAKETLTALEVESRALSQFDGQMRNLQSSLEQLSVHKNHQAETIEFFRRELNLLKRQVETLTETSGTPARTARDTSTENAVKTLQWLLKSVSNLKADVIQINQNLNVSKTMQHAEEVQKQIRLVQGEMQQMRHQWTVESTERQRVAADVAQLRTDMEVASENHQRCLKDIVHMTSEIQSLKSDWNITSVETESGTVDSRHRHRHLNHKLEELRTSFESVRDMQRHLEERLNSLSATTEVAPLLQPVEQRMEELAQQCALLDSKIQVSEAMLATLEASHVSMRERVELFGEQSDFQLREVQVAVDQLQYNFTQIQVQSEQALRRTELSDEKLSRISENVDSIVCEMEKDRISILSLQNRAMNETLQKCKDETREEIQDVKLQSIEYQLELLRNQIDAFNKTMGNWNEAFVVANASVDEPTKDSSSSEESNE